MRPSRSRHGSPRVMVRRPQWGLHGRLSIPHILLRSRELERRRVSLHRGLQEARQSRIPSTRIELSQLWELLPKSEIPACWAGYSVPAGPESGGAWETLSSSFSRSRRCPTEDAPYEHAGSNHGRPRIHRGPAGRNRRGGHCRPYRGKTSSRLGPQVSLVGEGEGSGARHFRRRPAGWPIAGFSYDGPRPRALRSASRQEPDATRGPYVIPAPVAECYGREGGWIASPVPRDLLLGGDDEIRRARHLDVEFQSLVQFHVIALGREDEDGSRARSGGRTDHGAVLLSADRAEDGAGG